MTKAKFSAEDLKRLGISEGEILQYNKKGLFGLALLIIGWEGHLLEFTKGSNKEYPKETPEAIKLIRHLLKGRNFDAEEVKKELENRLKKIEMSGPKIKEIK